MVAESRSRMVQRLAPDQTVWLSKAVRDRLAHPRRKAERQFAQAVQIGIAELTAAGFPFIVEHHDHREANGWTAANCPGAYACDMSRLWGFRSEDDAFAFRMRLT